MMTSRQHGTPHRRWLALYRRLASAYPHEFRMRYGEDLDRLGEDAIPEIWRRYGGLGLARLLADIAIHLPAQYLLEIRQDVVYALRMLAKSPGFASLAALRRAAGARRPRHAGLLSAGEARDEDRSHERAAGGVTLVGHASA